MKIWRVQNKNGRGPYWVPTTKKSSAVTAMQENHNVNLDKYPTAIMDSGIRRSASEGELYGFINEAQLRNWFSDTDLQVLAEDKFEVVIVDGEITAMGSHQLLFRKVDAVDKNGDSGVC